jgi:hypothetical protein
VWWPGLKNSPTVAHSCRKRQLKWVPSAWGYSWTTLSPRVINTEAWSSRLGVGRWTNNPVPWKGYCYETPWGEARARFGLYSHMMMILITQLFSGTLLVRNICNKITYYRGNFEINLTILSSLLIILLFLLLTCLWVCPIIIQPTDRYYEIKYRRCAIEGDLEAIKFNPVASTIQKWRKFKIQRWIQNFHQLTWDYETLYANRCTVNEQLLMTQLVWKARTTNMAGVWNLKFSFCFMERTLQSLHLDKRRFGAMKHRGHTYKFIWIIIFFNEAFEYGGGGFFKLLRYMQSFHHLTLDHYILYTDR